MKLKSKISLYKTWVEVSAGALRNNLRVAQKHVGKDVVIMAVVKSNAYGHGLKLHRRSKLSEVGAPNIRSSNLRQFGLVLIILMRRSRLKKKVSKIPFLFWVIFRVLA